jgi:predicted  nucleic acid-binding Zn-ribbon protein
VNFVQPVQSADDLKAASVELDGNICKLAHNGAALRQGEANGEMTANNLAALLRRVSGTSTREIDSLIGELQDLREKLHTDSERIHRDILEYAALSQHVMQLSKIISESVKRLPDAPSITG